MAAGLLAGQLRAGEGLLSSLGVFLEPKFTEPGAAQEIPGAKETVLAAARQTSSGALTLSAREWKEGALDWPAVLEAAIARATRLEQAMTIQWERDSRKIFRYALIESKDPFISSVIYSPGFVNRFRETLGEEVLVVVPDRYTLYVFPRYGATLDDFGPGLVRRYREAMFKVSLEVFLVAGGKPPRVVGKIGE